MARNQFILLSVRIRKPQHFHFPILRGSAMNFLKGFLSDANLLTDLTEFAPQRMPFWNASLKRRLL